MTKTTRRMTGCKDAQPAAKCLTLMITPTRTTMKADAQTHQALSLLQQAFDALEATADSDIDTFEDEEEEAQAVPAQYACRKIMEAMGLLRGA
jgi:hypothetical protein